MMNKGRHLRILILFCFCHNVKREVFSQRRISGKTNYSSISLNITDDIIEINNPCYKYNSCAYNKLVYVPNCYCDDLCEIYKDCCIDHVIHDNSLQRQHGKTDLGKEKFGDLNLECKVLYGRDVGVFLVSQCQSNNSFSEDHAQEHLIKKHFQDKIIVSGSDGLLYQNKKIAHCNGITKFEKWKVFFDLTFCFEDLDLTEVSNLSVEDIANYLYEIGCDYQVIPPKERLPRFCISFGQCDNSTSGIKLPVLTVDKTYLNEECCREFTKSDRCKVCHMSGLLTYDQLSTRFEHSMMAVFQFKNYDEKQENGIEGASQYSSKMLLRNARMSQLCVASVEGDVDIPLWSRAFMFFKLSLENALKEYNVVFKNVHSFAYRKHANTSTGTVTGYTYLQFQNDLKSYDTYLEIKAWLIQFNVLYKEYGNETRTINISSTNYVHKLTDCHFRSPTCKILSLYRIDHDQSDILNKIKTSDQYPRGKCKHVQGIVKAINTENKLTIKCTSIKKLHSRGLPMESKNALLMIAVYLCIENY